MDLVLCLLLSLVTSDESSLWFKALFYVEDFQPSHGRPQRGGGGATSVQVPRGSCLEAPEVYIHNKHPQVNEDDECC